MLASFAAGCGRNATKLTAALSFASRHARQSSASVANRPPVTCSNSFSLGTSARKYSSSATSSPDCRACALVSRRWYLDGSNLPSVWRSGAERIQGGGANRA